MKVVIASGNKHKIREISQIIGNKFDKIYSLSDLNMDVDIAETGKTFLENALIKAREICRLSGYCAVADDSGLVVDYLDGEPGVFSARYAGEPCDDKKNNLKLLDKMKNAADGARNAHFVSAIALCYPNGNYITAEGRAYGKILREEIGEGGFGYDPLFYSDDLKKTFAQANAEEKNLISHRAKALNDLAKQLDYSNNRR